MTDINLDIQSNKEIHSFLTDQLKSMGYTMSSNANFNLEKRYFSVNLESKEFFWKKYNYHGPDDEWVIDSRDEATRLIEFIKYNRNELINEPIDNNPCLDGNLFYYEHYEYKKIQDIEDMMNSYLDCKVH